jgi:hypothetical protein
MCAYLKDLIYAVFNDTHNSTCVQSAKTSPSIITESAFSGLIRKPKELPFGHIRMVNLTMSKERRDIIVDIDGTLADCSHRIHYIRGGRKKWKKFFACASLDKPRIEVVAQVRELAKQYNIHLVTGRPETYRQQTEKWLNHYRIPCDSLHMREDGDYRSDDVVKQEILNRHFDKDNIELVIDDRPRVIRMWQSNGLRVLDVGDGIEF